MTTPTPGQPLSEADVSLLQPGDFLLRKGRVVVFRNQTHLSGWVSFTEMDGTTGSTMRECLCFLGRPDQDGWIAHEGHEVAVRGILVDVKKRDGAEWRGVQAEQWGVDWVWADEEDPLFANDIIAYRPHAPVSRPGDGVEDVHVRANDAVRVHAPEMERSAENQRPKTRDWRDLRLVRFDGTDLYQWRGKQNSSIFEDQASEVFALTPPAEPVSRPAGEGEREAVARIVDQIEVVTGAHGPRIRPGEKARVTNAILALLSPAAPDAGSGEAWSWLESKPSMELSYSWGDEDEDGGWQVHECTGGRNDREWTLIASGETPLEAVQKAKAALQPRGER